MSPYRLDGESMGENRTALLLQDHTIQIKELLGSE
jgi:hypothetical protein